MNEQELMDKLLLSVTDYTNPNKKHWVILCAKFGFKEDDEFFKLLRDFSDKNTRIGDDSKSQSFDGLSIIEINNKIFNLSVNDEKIKRFFDLL